MYQYTHFTLITPTSTLLSCLMKRYTVYLLLRYQMKKGRNYEIKKCYIGNNFFCIFLRHSMFRYSYLVVCTKHIRCFYKFTTVAKINYCATSKNSCLQNICSIDGLEDRYMYWDQKEAICFASVSTSKVHLFLLIEYHLKSLVICILYK